MSIRSLLSSRDASRSIAIRAMGSGRNVVNDARTPIAVVGNSRHGLSRRRVALLNLFRGLDIVSGTGLLICTRRLRGWGGTLRDETVGRVVGVGGLVALIVTIYVLTALYTYKSSAPSGASDARDAGGMRGMGFGVNRA